LRHYAPKARLILVDTEDGALDLRGSLRELALANAGERIGVMLPTGISGLDEDLDWLSASMEVFCWGSWSELEELAQRLFTGLRQLDAAGCTVILCPVPLGPGIGVAIRDRLRKAAWKDEAEV
jgi:L-threonylcarbamoyladenylate synthase